MNFVAAKRQNGGTMKKLEQLYEGKAKKVFATEDPDVVIVRSEERRVGKECRL